MTNPTPPADPGAMPPAPTPPAPAQDPTPTPDKPDKPLGPGGEKALREEREARKAVERQLAELAPLRKLAEALGGTPDGDTKSDLERLTERLGQHEQQLASEREARWRAEVATAKGLTLDQAARLHGATREELMADADALRALFPAAPTPPTPPTPPGPAPDPSQGAHGKGAPDIDARIAQAQKAGDWKQVIELQTEKLVNLAMK